MSGTKSCCCPRKAFRQNVCLDTVGCFECEAERPNAGGKEIQLWLDYDLKIHTGNSDHPCILSHCVNTRASLMEVVINWTPETNKK